LEDVEVCAQRLRLGEGAGVGAGPMEAEAFGALDAARVDAALGEDGFVFREEVLAHDGDDAHGGEVAGGKSKVRGCAAENLRPLAVRGLNAVERYRTNYKNRHSPAFIWKKMKRGGYKYRPRIGASFSLVAGGMSLRSVRMAYLSASAQAHLRSFGIAATAARTTFAAFSAF